MKIVVVLLLLALAILHHDIWWWDDARPLVFGFIPIGLAWHGGISIAVGVVWFLAVTFCWPPGLDNDGLDADGLDADGLDAGATAEQR